jgi:hypothetical protein
LVEEKSYHRQSGEPTKAFEAFVVYRKMGPDRTTLKVAEHFGKTHKTYQGYSIKHKWVQRALDWDADQDKAAAEAELEAIRDMRRRHVEIALRMQELGGKTLKGWDDLADSIPASVQPQDMVRILKEGTALERLTLGEPDQITEDKTDQIDYSKYTPEELKQLRILLRKQKKDE